MKTRMRTRNENNATKNTSAWYKEAPEQRTDRQTDGWRRLPISDRATLNGIYLDPDVGIESEPKNCMKGSQSNSALLNFDFFCFAFVIEFHSQFVPLLFLKKQRTEWTNDRAIVFVIVIVTFGAPDEMIHIRNWQTDGRAEGQMDRLTDRLEDRL